MSPFVRRVLPVLIFTIVYLPIAVFALGMSQMGDCYVGDLACESSKHAGFRRLLAIVVAVYLVLAYGFDRLWRR